MVERQARMRMEIAILVFFKHQSLVTRTHNIQLTGVIGHNHLGGSSVGNCPPNRGLVPGPRFGLSSGGSLDQEGGYDGCEGTCRRMLVAAW